jgi:hypothetical protein
LNNHAPFGLWYLDAAGSDMLALCGTRTQTFDQCVTQCLDPNNRNVTNQTVYYVDLVPLHLPLSPCLNLIDLFVRVCAQAVEVNQTIIEITPYVGCGLITEFVDATDYSLCVEFMYGTFPLFKSLAWRVECLLTCPLASAGDFLVVVATIVLGFLWIFYELVVILAYERWVAHAPPHTHTIKRLAHFF